MNWRASSPLHRLEFDVHEACKRGDIEKVQSYLSQGKNVNEIGEGGSTLLHWACYGSHLEILLLLLQHPQIKVNATNNSGWSALHFLCAHSNGVAALSLLLSKSEIELDATNDSGYTPSQLADRRGNHEMVRLISKVREGSTALHEAVEAGDIKVVSSILELSPSLLRSTNQAGDTPLHIACHENKRIEVMEALFKNLMIDSDENTEALEVRNQEGARTAVILGTSSAVGKHGGYTKNSAGDTPLHLACRHGLMESAALLVTYDGIDVDTRDSTGSSPIDVALEHGHLQLGHLLLVASGVADINKENDQRETILHTAASQNLVHAVQLLLRLPDINPLSKDVRENTPLHLACEKGAKEKVVEALILSAPTALNQPNLDGDTPLHLACQSGNKDVVKWLLWREELEHRLCWALSMPNWRGFTPLHCACEVTHPDIIEMLLIYTELQAGRRKALPQTIRTVEQDAVEKLKMANEAEGKTHFRRGSYVDKVLSKESWYVVPKLSYHQAKPKGTAESTKGSAESVRSSVSSVGSPGNISPAGNISPVTSQKLLVEAKSRLNKNARSTSGFSVGMDPSWSQEFTDSETSNLDSDSDDLEPLEISQSAASRSEIRTSDGEESEAEGNEGYRPYFIFRTGKQSDVPAKRPILQFSPGIFKRPSFTVSVKSGHTTLISPSGRTRTPRRRSSKFIGPKKSSQGRGPLPQPSPRISPVKDPTLMTRLNSFADSLVDSETDRPSSEPLALKKRRAADDSKPTKVRVTGEQGQMDSSPSGFLNFAESLNSVIDKLPQFQETCKAYSELRNLTYAMKELRNAVVLCNEIVALDQHLLRDLKSLKKTEMEIKKNLSLKDGGENQAIEQVQQLENECLRLTEELLDCYRQRTKKIKQLEKMGPTLSAVLAEENHFPQSDQDDESNPTTFSELDSELEQCEQKLTLHLDGASSLIKDFLWLSQRLHTDFGVSVHDQSLRHDVNKGLSFLHQAKQYIYNECHYNQHHLDGTLSYNQEYYHLQNSLLIFLQKKHQGLLEKRCKGSAKNSMRKIIDIEQIEAELSSCVEDNERITQQIEKEIEAGNESEIGTLKADLYLALARKETLTQDLTEARNEEQCFSRASSFKTPIQFLYPEKGGSMSAYGQDIQVLSSKRHKRTLLVKEINTGKQMVLKELVGLNLHGEPEDIDCDEGYGNFPKRLRADLKKLSLLDHPLLTKLNGFFVEEGKLYLRAAYEEQGNLISWLEKIKLRHSQIRLKSLEEWPGQELTWLEWEEIRSTMRTLFQAVGELHRRGITHGNLNPTNILITKKRLLRLTDIQLNDEFVLSKSSNEDGEPASEGLYTAPEYRRLQEDLTDMKLEMPFTLDIWALGLLVLEVVTGTLYSFDANANVLRSTATGHTLNLEEMMETSTGRARLAFILAAQLLCMEADQRITVDKALLSPFFADSSIVRETCSTGNEDVTSEFNSEQKISKLQAYFFKQHCDRKLTPLAIPLVREERVAMMVFERFQAQFDVRTPIFFTVGLNARTLSNIADIFFKQLSKNQLFAPSEGDPIFSVTDRSVGENKRYFIALGRFVMKCVFDGVSINAHFPRALFYYILGIENLSTNPEECVSYLCEFQPTMGYILGAALLMRHGMDGSLSGMSKGDLYETSEPTPVTDTNASSVVKSSARHHLVDIRRACLSSFKEGFSSLFLENGSCGPFWNLSPTELAMTFRGNGFTHHTYFQRFLSFEDMELTPRLGSPLAKGRRKIFIQDWMIRYLSNSSRNMTKVLSQCLSSCPSEQLMIQVKIVDFPEQSGKASTDDALVHFFPEHRVVYMPHYENYATLSAELTCAIAEQGFTLHGTHIESSSGLKQMVTMMDQNGEILCGGWYQCLNGHIYCGQTSDNVRDGTGLQIAICSECGKEMIGNEKS